MSIDQIIREAAPAQAEMQQQASRLRSEVLGRAMTQPPRLRETRRWRFVVPITAATALALTIAPMVGDGGGTAQAAVVMLAETAANQPAAVIGDGYLHQVVIERQTIDDVEDPGPLVTTNTRFETWTDAEGRVYRLTSVDDSQDGTHKSTDVFRLDSNTPADIAALPADPDALQKFVESVASGHGDQETAVAEQFADLLRDGFAPPAVRSAALRVLSELPNTSVAEGIAPGRSTVTVSFGDPSNDGMRALVFDAETSELVGERSENANVAFTMTIQSSAIQHRVSEEIRKALETATK